MNKNAICDELCIERYLKKHLKPKTRTNNICKREQLKNHFKYSHLSIKTDIDNQEIIFSEAVFCDICDKLFEIISKYSHLKALSYDEFDRYKHEILIFKNHDINKINNIIDTFINEYDKNYDFHLKKYKFKLVFNKQQYVVNIETNPRTRCVILSSGYLLDEAINDVNIQGYTFDHIDEFNIVTIADKMDMTYVFFIKHNMSAFELKLNLIHAKNPHLLYSPNSFHNHPLIRKISYIPF